MKPLQGHLERIRILLEDAFPTGGQIHLDPLYRLHLEAGGALNRLSDPGLVVALGERWPDTLKLLLLLHDIHQVSIEALQFRAVNLRSIPWPEIQPLEEKP